MDIASLPPPKSLSGYTPIELAPFFRKSPIWIYRRIWEGKLLVVEGIPTVAISPQEVVRFIGASIAYSAKSEGLKKATVRKRRRKP